MTLSSVIVLFLLGILSLRRYREASSTGKPLPRRSYLWYFSICGLLLLNGIAAILAWYPHLEILWLEVLCCIFLLPAFGGIWWIVHFLRDGWLFRGVLLFLILFLAAMSGWSILRSQRFSEECDRTLANLHRCADLLTEGKRRELKQHFRSTPDGSLREWNDSFERAFPEGEDRK